MGNNISPSAFRLGFFRAWSALYTESIQVRNFDKLVKSQMILVYLEGFFRRWTWDGKKSFFTNYLFSHVELSWSFKYLHMYVYVYSTNYEYLSYKLKKNLRGRVRLGNAMKSAKRLKPDVFQILKKKSVVKSKFSTLFFKNNNIKQLHSLSSIKLWINLYKYAVVNPEEFLEIFQKILIDHNISIDQGRKKIFESLTSITNIFEKKKRKLPVALQYFLFKKHVINLVRDIYNTINKSKTKKFNGEYAFLRRFRGEEFSYKDRFAYFLNKKNDMSLLSYKYFLFLRGLLYFKYYKTYLIMLDYFFSMRPLETVIKRYFYKDFFNLLGLHRQDKTISGVTMNLVRLLPRSLTAAALSKHLWLKLTKKYAFGFVVQGILRMVKRAKLFRGLLMKCNGRFTKKQKAWHSVYRYGRVPLGEKKASIEDSLILVRLRYGVGSVKLNIHSYIK